VPCYLVLALVTTVMILFLSLFIASLGGVALFFFFFITGTA
jgi:hypothetical protein